MNQTDFDYTKLSDFMICQRRGYFAHVRDWQPEVPSAAIVFGACWHRAMESIYKNPKDKASEMIERAGTAFVSEWRLYGLDEESWHPRSVSRGLELLEAYVEHYREEIERTIVLAVERPFQVLLEEEGPTYHGRLDAVVRLPQTEGIYVLEHKTASSISGSWREQFSPNVQIDGYCHAARSLWGPDVRGVLVNGVAVLKTKVEFSRVPVMRQLEQLEAWRWEVLDYINLIEWEYHRFLEFQREEGTAEFMRAFPKNTTACTHYGGCRYLDICKAYPNPEVLREPPEGFVVRPWDYTAS